MVDLSTLQFNQQAMQQGLLSPKKKTELENQWAEQSGYTTPLQQKVADAKNSFEQKVSSAYNEPAKQNPQTGMWFDPQSQSYTSKNPIGSLPEQQTAPVNTGSNINQGAVGTQKVIGNTVYEVIDEASGAMRKVRDLPVDTYKARQIQAEKEGKVYTGPFNQEQEIEQARLQAEQDAKASRTAEEIKSAKKLKSVTSQIDALKAYHAQSPEGFVSSLSTMLPKEAIANLQNQMNQSSVATQEAMQQIENIKKQAGDKLTDFQTTQINTLNEQIKTNEALRYKTMAEAEKTAIDTQQKAYDRDVKIFTDLYPQISEEKRQELLESLTGIPADQREILSEALAQKTKDEAEKERQAQFKNKVDNTETMAGVISSMLVNESPIDYTTAENMANNSLFNADQIVGMQAKFQEIAKQYKKGTPEYNKAVSDFVNEVKGKTIEEAKVSMTTDMQNMEYYRSLIAKGDNESAEKFATMTGMTKEQKTTATSGVSGVASGTSASGISYNTVGDTFNVITPAGYNDSLSRVTGEAGKQCAEFVNDTIGTKLFRDTYESKTGRINITDPNQVSAGDMFVEKAGENGHVGFIARKYMKDGQLVADTIEYNYKNDQTRSDRTAVPMSEFAGFVSNPKKTQNDNLYSQNAINWAKNIIDGNAKIENVPQELKTEVSNVLASDIIKKSSNSGDTTARTFKNIDQANAHLYGTRMQDAGKIIENLEGTIKRDDKGNIISFSNDPDDYLVTSFWGLTGDMSYLTPNALLSNEEQKFKQAKDNFINAVLRRESGAAIAANEYDNANRQYFPVPGDSYAVMEQKRENRRTAIKEIFGASGYPEDYTIDKEEELANNISKSIDKNQLKENKNWLQQSTMMIDRGVAAGTDNKTIINNLP